MRYLYAQSPPAKIRTASANSRLAALVTFVIFVFKGRKIFVVAKHRTCAEYADCRQNKYGILGDKMLIIKAEANLTENHQQARIVDTSAPSAQKQKKGTSQKKIESNRRNSLRSTGPENTQRTRHNAIRHGLLAAGLTRWETMLKSFKKTFTPSRLSTPPLTHCTHF
jgi:hypothetical protein